MTRFAVCTVGLLTCSAAMVDAQVVERPVREVVTPDRAKSSSTLTLSSTSLGGYDENLGTGSGTIDPLAPQMSGYTGFADVALRYQHRAASRSLELGGHGFVNSFRNVGLTPSYGGDMQARFSTGLARRHRFDVRQDVRNEPLLALGGFSVLRQDVGAGTLPDANPLNGLEDRRSWGSNSALELGSQWSTRDSLAWSYRYDSRRYRDGAGDTRASSGSAVYARKVGRRSSLRASYGLTDSQFLENVGWVSSRHHAVEAGLSHERRFSPTRRLLVTAGFGGTQVQTVERSSGDAIEFLAPSAYGVLRLDWARTWSISTDYRRAPATLDGLSAESLLTDAALVRIGGFATRRSELAFSVAYAEGQSGGQGSAAFTTYSGTAQFQFAINREWSALVSHTYYTYSISGIETISPGFPKQIDRNALKVGVIFNFPIVGGGARAGRQRSKD